MTEVAPIMAVSDPQANLPPQQPPLTSATANPSAASAALSAFTGARRPSSSSLSAAAAAAALRARPTTPTNVAEVQTKRTSRRSASVSSSRSGSTDRLHQQQPLRRQSSSGSMSERTFRRSPSPGSSAAYRRADHDEMPPPVPAIPESVNMTAARNRSGAKPKSLGLMTTPVRTASQKMTEGSSKKPWFGAANVGDLGNVRTSDAIMTTAGSPTVQTRPQSQGYSPAQDDDDRPGSPGSSVNFSYPARVRVASPTSASLEETERTKAPAEQPKPKKRSSTISPQRGGSVRAARSSSVASDQSLVYDPNSRRMITQAELLAVEHKVKAASEARPKKKKKSAPARAGSHLAKGTVARSHGTAVDNGVANEAALAAAASLKSHRGAEGKRSAEEREEPHEEPETQPTHQGTHPEAPETPEPTQISHAEVSVSPASNAPEVVTAPQFRTAEPRESVLHRMPSVVKEEEESYHSEAEAQPRVSTPPNTAAALDAVPVRHSVYAHGVPSPPYSENTDDLHIETPHHAPAELAAAATSSPVSTTSTQGRGSVAEPRETKVVRSHSRTHSNSPARSARFGAVQETLTVKHEPPARSTSPRKSALKQTSPSRGASPTGETSDAGVELGAQEAPVQRKKSVRVSFDDENTVVVGEAANSSGSESPTPQSPQQTTTKKPWYSNLGIGKKKGAVPLEDDEVMKPRPMLPSFGSVRGRKVSPRPAEERPLVRPQEPIYEAEEIPTPDLDKKTTPETPGHSNDHALATVIHLNSSNNGANISKVREPLPPVVTSIEGYGYGSDTVSSDDDSALLADTPKLEAEESMMSQASTLVPETHTQTKAPQAELEAGRRVVEAKDLTSAPTVASETVPAISITQPSPRPEQENNRSSYIHFPGEFPETETETDGETLARNGAAPRSVVQAADGTTALQTPATIHQMQTAVPDSSDESEGNSVYSDAYEDLSDIEGDGFQSLDAVVESPMVATPPRNVLEKAQAHREEETTPTPQPRREIEAGPATPTVSTTGENATEPADPWAAAKAYWRSLTAEKRAQLEKEAVEEAGADADLEEVPEARKPRRKKSVEKRNAEKKAIEQQRAAADSGRTYMIKPGTKVGPEEYNAPPDTTLRSQQGQNTNSKAESGPRLRKSMRGPAEATPPVENTVRMRKSMRSGPSEQPAPRQRPASHQPLGNTSVITSGKHARTKSETTPVTSQTLTGLVQPTLRRRGSDSSASSFKRARPATSGGFGFRKSMRTDTGSMDLQGPSRDQHSSRFSIRSISPGRNVASPPVSMGTRMRTTLRGDVSPRRGSDDSGKGYLRFSGSFGRSSEKRGKRRSRFGDDSSDEDEVAAPRFASRFADSSDEDVAPEPLAASSMPKTMRSGARGQEMPSPPLPEEEEMSAEELGEVEGDEKDQQMTNGSAVDSTIRRSRSGRALDSGRPSSRRSGFMSSVLRRNKKHDGGGKISRPGLTESAARRDTNLERSTDELAALRANTFHEETRPMSPRLQKKFPAGSNWPLSDEGAGEVSKQPQSPNQIAEKDGVVVNGDDTAAARSSSVVRNARSQPSMNRPAFLARRTMSAQSQPLDMDGTKKKKKFGALRRMFKIDD